MVAFCPMQAVESARRAQPEFSLTITLTRPSGITGLTVILFMTSGATTPGTT